MARNFEVVRLLVAGALTLAWAGCGEYVASPDDEAQEDFATVRSAVSWDTLAKPVPKAFLFRRTNGMKCCMGKQSSDPTCISPRDLCAEDSTGLVKQAGLDKTAEYYWASGQGTLTTLQKFKDAYNVPQRIPGESLTDYRARAAIVIYYNASELGLGRELGCGESGTGSTYKVGCYVTNFGDPFASMNDPNSSIHREFNYPTGENTGLYNAVHGVQPKGTVVISYDGSRPADHKVQFGAYDANGNQTNKAQLDTMGARPIPEICTSCHGGMWDGNALGDGYYGLAKKARFLPLVTSLVVFPSPDEDVMASYYSLSQQEANIKRVNEFAWKVRNEALTLRQQFMLNTIYSPTPSYVNCSFNISQSTCNQYPAQCYWFGSVCRFRPVNGSGTLDWVSGSTTQRPDLIGTTGFGYSTSVVSGTDITQRELYRNVILRNCDTCHLAMDGSEGGNSFAYNDFASWNSLTATAAVGRVKSNIGVTGSGTSTAWQTSQVNYGMPHSQNLNARFWSDGVWAEQSTGLGVCRIGGTTKPAADCLLKALGAQRPAGSPPSGAQAQSSADCGQTMGDAHTSSTAGYNSGRRRVNGLCQSGCERAAVFCPGTEQNHKVSAGGEFSGTRQECVLNAGSSTLGTCKSCGRLHQPICRNIGGSCDTSLNPSCTNLPACHEGIVQGNPGSETCEDVPIGGVATALQSSLYDPNQWWIGAADLAIDGYYWPNFADGHASHTGWESYPNWQLWWQNGNVHISQIDIYNGADLEGFQNVGVYYADANGNWQFIPDGNMTSSGQGAPWNMATTFVLPAPVYTNSILITSNGGPYIELAEVAVRGW